jgi:hypothetical protein
VRLTGARRVATAPHYALWLPTGTPRLALYATGRYDDGWLAGSGSIRLWPRSGRHVAGRLHLTIAAPGRAVRLVLSHDGIEQTVRLRAGQTRGLRIAACGTVPWTLSFVAAAGTSVRSGRLTSARTSGLTFRPDAAACPR